VNGYRFLSSPFFADLHGYVWIVPPERTIVIAQDHRDRCAVSQPPNGFLKGCTFLFDRPGRVHHVTEKHHSSRSEFFDSLHQLQAGTIIPHRTKLSSPSESPAISEVNVRHNGSLTFLQP
jgi:hypothetical protein